MITIISCENKLKMKYQNSILSNFEGFWLMSRSPDIFPYMICLGNDWAFIFVSLRMVRLCYGNK